jgi:hypothetical protein
LEVSKNLFHVHRSTTHWEDIRLVHVGNKPACFAEAVKDEVYGVELLHAGVHENARVIRV